MCKIITPMETKEKNFENDIESYLLSHGYVKGNQDTYDKSRAILHSTFKCNWSVLIPSEAF